MPVPSAEDLLARVDPEIRGALSATLTAHLPATPLDVPGVRALDDRIAVRCDPDPRARVVEVPGGATVRVHGPRLEDADPGDGMPALLWIHGGGMFLGAAVFDDAFCAGLGERLGAPVVAVDYRLAPEHPHPAPLEDCLAALDWCLAHSARVVVAGGSAGGGLAAALCLRARDLGGRPIAAAHLYYPMLDDRHVSASARQLVNAPVWNRRLADLAWAAYLGGRPADVSSAPARAQDLTGFPPTYLDVGELDLFVDEDAEFARRLTAAGVDTEFHIVPGAVHAFELVAPDATLSRATTDRRTAALRRHLGTSKETP